MALGGSHDNEMNHISNANASRHMSRVDRVFFVSFIANIVNIGAMFSIRASTTGSDLCRVFKPDHRATVVGGRLSLKPLFSFINPETKQLQ